MFRKSVRMSMYTRLPVCALVLTRKILFSTDRSLAARGFNDDLHDNNDENHKQNRENNAANDEV